MAHKGTWQSHASPRGRLHGAEMTWTHDSATQVHANARVAPRGNVRENCESWAHRLVCPGESIGEVAQMRYAAPCYIPVKFSLILPCGTMFP